MNHTFELIPLTIEAKGEVITNNISEFRDLVREALTNLNLNPSDDEEFGQAELDVKALKDAESRVTDAKAKALADAEDLNAMFAALDETSEEIRAARLQLEKTITRRKDEVKAEIVAEAIDLIDCAPRIRQSVFGKSVAEAIKGKRTIDSIKKAVEVVVTCHNGAITKNRKAIDSFVNAHGEELVLDREELEVKSPDSVEAELRRRFEAKKAAEEKRRLEKEAADARAAEAKAKEAAAPAAQEAAQPANVVPIKDTAPADLPKPPKISSIPTGPSPRAEWMQWEADCKAAFAPLKEARQKLRHPENIERAAVFAEAIATAWNIMRNAGKEAVNA